MQGWISFIYSINHLRLVIPFITTPRTANTAMCITSLPLQTVTLSHSSTFHPTPSHSNRHATVSIPSHLSKLNNDFGCYSVQRCMNHTQSQLSRKALEACLGICTWSLQYTANLNNGPWRPSNEIKGYKVNLTEQRCPDIWKTMLRLKVPRIRPLVFLKRLMTMNIEHWRNEVDSGKKDVLRVKDEN